MSDEKNQSKDNSQGIVVLLVTGLLTIITTVVGEVLKGYWSTQLADKDFHSKLILDALKSNNLEERKNSLQFLVTTNLITDSNLKSGITQSIQNNNIPRFIPYDSFDSSGITSVPSAKQQVIQKDPTLKSSKLALVGLKVRSGDIIDAITPIFAEITPNLNFEKKQEGQRIGGTGGSETLLEKEGYIITGINYERGNYFGRDEVIHIQLIWSKLTPQGIDQNAKFVSPKIGSGNFATVSQSKELRTKPENYISDLSSNISTHTGGGTVLNDLYIKQENIDTLKH
ncbi:hypothetical protein [Nostoc sp.]